MANEVSGAPDKTQSESPIMWDENNRLVHPELKEVAIHESRVALGLEKGEPVNEGDPTTPQEFQALPSQTTDPMTSPRPVRADGSLVLDMKDDETGQNVQPKSAPTMPVPNGGSNPPTTVGSAVKTNIPPEADSST